MIDSLLLLAACAASPPQQPAFAPPVRMRAGDDYVRVEAPGYAFPCWADVDGDGVKDLVVGQFRGGKMRVFKNLGGGRLAPGKWLEVNGNAAEIPGVW